MKLNPKVHKFITDAGMYNETYQDAIVYVLAMTAGLSKYQDSSLSKTSINQLKTLLLHNNYITNDWEVKHPIFIHDNEVKNNYTIDDLDEKVKAFRKIFQGTKNRAMGDAKACKKKIVKWLKDNSEYTIDDIIRAAEYYKDTFNGDYTYMKRADYFIEKTGISELSAVIGDLDDPQNDIDEFRKTI